ILFLFFNTDLISLKQNRNKGVIAFVNDYIAWVIKGLIEARVSRATFKGSKIAFIYFIYNSSKLSSAPLLIDREKIIPKHEVKVLGVILN
ncbi:hypothetical protein K469DRAFT_595200, partial [Zopfia rhizophila CBS 207.26]